MTNHITSVHLENFGPHRDLTVPFTPGVNLIRAHNRAGKSWILRGLALTLFNSCPASFNRDDALDEIRHVDPATGKRASFFAVTVSFADGAVVRRFRQNNVNQYVVTRPGEKPQTYEAVGSGFFSPVGDVTGIRPLMLDGKTEYRPQVRLFGEPLFLLSESPSKQDDILSRLLGINIISAAEVLAEKDGREAQAESRRQEDTFAIAQADQRRWSGAPGMLDEAEYLVAAAGHADELTVQAQDAAKKLAWAGELKGQRRRNALRAVFLADGGRLAEVLKAGESMAQKSQIGRQLIDKLVEARKYLTIAQRKVAELSRALPLPSIDTAVNAAAQAASAASLWGKRVQAAEAQGQAHRTVQAAQEAAERGQLEYRDMLVELGTCPLCGQVIGDGAVLH